MSRVGCKCLFGNEVEAKGHVWCCPPHSCHCYLSRMASPKTTVPVLSVGRLQKMRKSSFTSLKRYWLHIVDLFFHLEELIFILRSSFSCSFVHIRVSTFHTMAWSSNPGASIPSTPPPRTLTHPRTHTHTPTVFLLLFSRSPTVPKWDSFLSLWNFWHGVGKQGLEFLDVPHVCVCIEHVCVAWLEFHAWLP